MKIFFDGRSISWYKGTGIGNYSYSLIKSLSYEDNFNKYTIYSDLIKNLGDNFQFVNPYKSYTDFWKSISVSIDNIDTDFSIYHCPHNGIGMKYSPNTKYIVTLHDVIPLAMPDVPSKSYLQIFNNSINSIVTNSDAIITVSNYSKQDIHRYLNYPLDKIFVTHIAPDDIFKQQDVKFSKEYINKKYGIANDFLLYIGGFSPRKNIISTIDVFNNIRKKHKNLNLVICGKKGISYDLYRARVEKLGINSLVFFPGFIPQEDLPPFYSACKIFLYPSQYEGFGLPPLESMACGSPVIASNVTSIPEIVGDSALLFDPNSQSEYYTCIDNMLCDEELRNLYIKKGFEQIKKYSFLKTAKETLKIYESVSK